MKIIFFVFVLFSFLYADAHMQDWELTKKSFDKVKILDSKVLYYNKIGDEKFFGISALEYDKKSKTLYMLNDRSRVFAFHIEIKNNKIKKLIPLFSKRLRNKKNKYFFKWRSDSEGIAKYKNRFYISFEGRYPKILIFNKNFKQAGRLRLPKPLRNYLNYKSKNKGLESLAYTKSFGMVTAPERRLKKTPKFYHTLFNRYGKICRFKKRKDKLCLVDLEDDGQGNLIGLFRKFSFSHFSFTTKLKRIYIQNIKNGICPTEDLMTLKNQGGDATDNFEGLVRLNKNLYLMISDDNDKFFQNTLLVLFEVL